MLHVLVNSVTLEFLRMKLSARKLKKKLADGKVLVVDPAVHILGVRETIELQVEFIVPVEHTIDTAQFGIVQSVITS